MKYLVGVNKMTTFKCKFIARNSVKNIDSDLYLKLKYDMLF